MKLPALGLVCVVGLIAVTPIAAQTEFPAAIAVTSGVASGSGQHGGSIGASFTYDFSPRVAVETTMAFADRGVDSSAWSGDARMVLTLVQGRRARPYVSAGAGVYHARFDVDEMLGRMGSQPQFAMPGINARMAPAAWMAGYMNQVGAPQAGVHMFGSMPAFYQPRMTARAQGMAAGSFMTGRMDGGFTDPAVSVGGGVRFDMGSRLMARPDARVLVVMRNGRTQKLGVFTIDLGVRF